MMPRRKLLVALLIGSAALFVVGSLIERSQEDHHSDSMGEDGGMDEMGGEEGGEDVHSDSDMDDSEKVLGIDIESTPMIVLAVVITLALAAAAWFLAGTLILWIIVAFGLAFAVFDFLEAVYQNGESHTGLVLLAVALGFVHLAVAFVSGDLARTHTTAPTDP